MKAESQAPRKTKAPSHPDLKKKKDLYFIALLDKYRATSFLLVEKSYRKKKHLSSQEVVSL